MKNINKTLQISGAVCGLILAGHGAQAQNLFVGSYGSESIVEISGGTQTTFATGLDYPTGLGFDNSGDLFEVDQDSGNIYEWAGTGTTRTTFASGLNNPSFIAFNTAGDLFVNVGGTAIDEYNSKGTMINAITGFDQATSLAFDNVGDLYVGDVNGGGANAGTITEIGQNGSRSTFASGLNYPVGMAFNAAGDLFVSGGGGFDTITEITPGHVQSQFASGLDFNNAIAFDKAGDMFVAEEAGGPNIGEILEYPVNGTPSIYNETISRPFSLAFEGVTLPVPEPTTYALFGLGLITLALMLSNKKRAV